MAPLDSQETQPIESEVPSDEVLEAQIKADEQRYEELIRLKMSQERQHEDTFHDAEPSNVQDSSDVKEQQPKKDLPVTVRVGSHEKKIKAQSDWVNALKSGVDPSEPRAGKRSGSRSYTDDSRPSGVPSKSDYGFGSRRDSDWSEADDSFLKELDELDQSVDIRPPLTDQHDPLESPQRTSSVKPTPPLMFTEAQLAVRSDILIVFPKLIQLHRKPEVSCPEQPELKTRDALTRPLDPNPFALSKSHHQIAALTETEGRSGRSFRLRQRHRPRDR